MISRLAAMEAWQLRISRAIAEVVLPVGMLALLTGMLWVGEHGLYPKLFQYLVALPVLLLIAVRPRCVVELADSLVVRWVLVFFGVTLISLLWSHPEDAPLSLVRRPFMILLVFLAANEIASRAPQRLELLMRMALTIATCAAAYSLGRFFLEGAQGRLFGYGALYNPLLVSHVFGFFAAFALGNLLAGRQRPPLLIALSALLLVAVLLATGSRTPLMAMTATFGWLLAISMNRQVIVASISLAVVSLIVFFLWPDILLQRGLSYRPQIWQEAFRQIMDAPWFGHGFGSPLSINVPGIDYPFSEPHNLTLSVMYDLGIVGVVVWLGMYLSALAIAWQLRVQRHVVAVSAAVVYGFISGMTEGGAFLSRPKEHWFVVWIPIALFAAVARSRAMESR